MIRLTNGPAGGCGRGSMQINPLIISNRSMINTRCMCTVACLPYSRKFSKSKTFADHW